MCGIDSQGINMRTMSAAIALMALMGLTGCATNYQAGNSNGGFREKQLDKNVFKVSFSGNAYTSIDQAEGLAMLRSADITLQHGFTHFVITEGRSHEEVKTRTTPAHPVTTTSTMKNGDIVTRTSMTGERTYTDKFPSAVYTITTYTKKPDVSGPVYDAKSICASHGEKYEAKCGVRRSSLL